MNSLKIVNLAAGASGTRQPLKLSGNNAAVPGIVKNTVLNVSGPGVYSTGRKGGIPGLRTLS